MQKKAKNIGINAVLNVIRQGLNVLFPLISYPYALRVLGVESIGKVNYCSSIIGYFSYIAMLGITNYAIREGARIKDDKNEFERFTSQIFTINTLSTILSYILLALTILVFNKLYCYKEILLIQSISIGLTTLGVDWINSVYEDYFLLTIRSIITNVISLVLLFVFVNSEKDYCIYALLTVISNGIICITNLYYCRRYTKIRFTININLKKHIKPILILFSNAIAVTIYVNVDTTMLGIIKGDYSVGIYSAAVKVYNIAKNIIAAIYIVSVPRLSLFAGNEQWDDYKKLCTNIICSIMIVLLPFGIGLVCLSSEIMKLVGGNAYDDSAIILSILGISLIFAIFGGFLTVAVNITLKREKISLMATGISAIVNLLLNLFFIPILDSIGAAITTLLSELLICVYCFIRLPNKEQYLNIQIVKRSLIRSIFGTSFIVISYYFSMMFFNSYIIRMGFVAFLSSVAYVVFLIIVKDELLYPIILRINNKFFSKKNNKLSS